MIEEILVGYLEWEHSDKRYNKKIQRDIFTQRLLRSAVNSISLSVISTADLSKFNIIPKAFTPNTTSILLLQKAKKC
jgi:hypothetical protein